ncbi:hypothetical protein SAMN06265222_102368 [Neorhodopirellula lusitana]|uniref:Secreted protein n=1 Tax=Neorhodopirellula lusitana TaxID=445327 RepID=A0ABY1PU13_9BACT|nr:hypothetical protein [Neorhodopirellula lusitana]SMP47971.1 hypothetical protein SAMN06265222_102368 [Neorhodopirellula lusitana]
MSLRDHIGDAWLVAIMVAVAALINPCVGHADSESDTFAAFVANRLAKFDQCHTRLSIVRETDQGPRTSRVEIWVKGEKIRNDFLTQHSRATVVVAGDRYILRYIGGEVLTGDTSEFKDIWKHFEVIHPASMGATRSGVSVFEEGKLHWAISTKAKAAKVEESANVVRVSSKRDIQFPVSIDMNKLKQFGSLELYMKANPDNPFKMKHVEFDAQFSNANGGELLSYSSAIGELNAAPSQETFLNNCCSLDAVSGIWYPARSEWTKLINGKQFQKSVVTVEYIDFSKVDESVFTAQGISLQE